jgi:hypothetical protein
MNFIIENRKIYLTLITKNLSPCIFQGIDSIYQEAKKISNNNDLLKNFQVFLKKIKDWSNEMVEMEKTRILVNTKDSNLFLDMIKLYLKYTFIQLSNHKDKLVLIDDSFLNFDVNEFIKNLYIEVAKEIYLNPFLFYDKLTSIEIKKNQNIVLEIIKDKIESVLIELLPLEEIVLRQLQINLSDYEKPNLPQIGGNISLGNILNGIEEAQPEVNQLEMLNVPLENQPSEKFINASQVPNDSTQDILSLINETKKQIETDKSKSLEKIEETSEKSEKSEKSESEKTRSKTPEEKVIEIGKSSNQNGGNSLKKIMDELKESSYSETSVSYVPPSEEYDEIFSNGSKNKKSSDNAKKDLNKNKYFANYLKV